MFISKSPHRITNGLGLPSCRYWGSTVFRSISIISLSNTQGKIKINLSQRILLMFNKASHSRKRPPSYICSRQISLAAIFRKQFAGHFTVLNYFSSGDHYISYHLKKVGWFQVEWQVSLELGLLVLSSGPFQDGSKRKHKCKSQLLPQALETQTSTFTAPCSCTTDMTKEVSRNVNLFSKEPSHDSWPWMSNN